ncbi:hypothetical protein EVAR_88437_1 [Eumeta japonica]|uniref:Integrase zinc-binding domain-containing protein n=1 Tax=Eumeta variegata TaxID=151549 RepID=A0A4C1SL53_EUMVA|nr:hypothetical protein EVAR_88437_1 [Eumeta japonica]
MNSERPTKRQVLKIVMSLFDPLGLASPVTTKAKQLLQEIWRRGTGWDDEIDQDLATQYTDATTLQLHICGCQRDGLRSSPLLASDRFSRSRFDITDNSQIESGAAQNHVDTETRTPGGRHGNQNGDHCYRGARQKTEHQILLDGQQDRAPWLKNGARSYKPFVAHRIAAIEENSTLNEWRWNRPRRRLNRNAKHPPILSGDHHITRLYIEHTHRQLHHAGAEATINECRQRYYITRIRTVTRYNKAVYSVPNKESVPASPPTGTTLEQVGTSPTPVHLHGDRLLRR